MCRTVLMPLLLFTISMACMGQTFQYSRGWTNGKRAPLGLRITGTGTGKEEIGMPEIISLPDGVRKSERCSLQLQRLLHDPYLLRSALYSAALSPLRESGAAIRNRNANLNSATSENNNSFNGNNPFDSHHQSQEQELLDELSTADTSDYQKH